MHMPPSRSFWLLWAVLVIYGTWGGWRLPVSAEGQGFPAGALGFALAVVPGLAFVLVGFKRHIWRTVPYPRMQARADQILGSGTYKYLFLEAGVALILGSGAVLTGLVGLTRCVMLNASSSAILTSVFFLSGGFGMLCMFALNKSRGGNRSDA